VQREQWRRYKELGINPVTNIKTSKDTANRLLKEGKHNFQTKEHLEKMSLQQKIVRECPHCGKKGRGSVMFRYHFDKCKTIIKLST
jgi:hypothetical protein